MATRPLYCGKFIPLSVIQRTVSEVTKLPLDVITSPATPGSRKREKVQARQLSMYFSCIYTNLGLQSIAANHGKRDHATALHACRTIEDLASYNNPEIIDNFRELKIRLSRYARNHSRRKEKPMREGKLLRLKLMIKAKVPLHIREKVFETQYN